MAMVDLVVHPGPRQEQELTPRATLQVEATALAIVDILEQL